MYYSRGARRGNIPLRKFHRTGQAHHGSRDLLRLRSSVICLP
jgi:hypothetical protein